MMIIVLTYFCDISTRILTATLKIKKKIGQKRKKVCLNGFSVSQFAKKTNKQNIKKYISTQKPVQMYLIIQINIGIFARESTTKTWTAFQYGVKKLQRCCNENATLNRILNTHIE